MTGRRLIEGRSRIVWGAVAVVIAYAVLLTRVRKTWISLTTLEIATAFATAALLGYPFVLATAYAASLVKREAGTWVAIGLYLFGAFWGVAFIVILLLNFLMSTGIYGRAFDLGDAAVRATMLVTGVWGIRGGNAARLLSRNVMEALALATIILALWWSVRDIAGTSWAGQPIKERILYFAFVALFALSVAAGVRFVLGWLEDRASQPPLSR
jgi:hypothetical protein